MRQPRVKRSAPAPTADLLIERLGTDAAGLARHDGRLIAVPGTLPGERIRLSGKTFELLAASPDRVTPPCRHFGTCGGCALQHMTAEPYAAFKRRIVVDALARLGLDGSVVASVSIGKPTSRRRATFAVACQGTTVALGFHTAAGHRIVDLAECKIVVPEIETLVKPLRQLMAQLLLLGGKASAALTQTESGIDLGLTLPRLPDLSGLERLADFAEAHDLARLWWRHGAGEPSPIAERRRPILRFDGIAVTLPPGGFLQATQEGEAAMIAVAREALCGGERIADLFAGLGTFALSLAGSHAVHAVEGDAAAVTAMQAAQRQAMLSRLTIERRDLEQRPLTADELNRFDAVLFDPPRAGAAAQSRELARSRVPVILAVSCNPATFARDAAILVAGGYRIEKIVPIDQFMWSSHIELVAVLRRCHANETTPPDQPSGRPR